MREDMHRLVSDAPGGWHGSFRGRKVEFLEQDEPVYVGRVRIRPLEQDWDTGPRARCAPLYRFLRSRIGQPWSKVYAEASEKYVHGMWKSVREWIADHVSQDVWRNAAGELVYNTRFAGVQYVTYNDFYVDPDSGLLCESDNVRNRLSYKEMRAEQEANRALVFRKGPPGIQYHKRNDVWYEVTLGQRPQWRPENPWIPHPKDSFRKSLWQYAASIQLYGDGQLYAISHRALSRRDVLRLRLP